MPNTNVDRRSSARSFGVVVLLLGLISPRLAGSQDAPGGGRPRGSVLVRLLDPLHRQAVLVTSDPALSGRVTVWVRRLVGDSGWAQIPSSGEAPSARRDASGAYDPAGNRFVIFGGEEIPGRFPDGVRLLSLGDSARWSRMEISGSRPGGRRSPVVAWDNARRQLLVLGGLRFAGRIEDSWALSVAPEPRWRRLPGGAGFLGRGNYAAAVDSAGERLLVFGGRLNRSATSAVNRAFGIHVPPTEKELLASPLGGVWELALDAGTAWKALEASGKPPALLAGSAIACDAPAHRLIVFGSAADSSGSQAWELTLAGPPAWRRLAWEGEGPAERGGTLLCANGGTLALVGGNDRGGHELLDLWTLALEPRPRWTLLANPYPAPRARYSFSLANDRTRRRAVLFGGRDGRSFYNEVWTLGLDDTSRWRPCHPAGVPPAPRCQHVAVLDVARNRIVVLGGYDAEQSFRDVWALSLAGEMGWTKLPQAGDGPRVQAYLRGVMDPQRDRVVVFGLGSEGTWSLALGDTVRWSKLETTGSRPPDLLGHSFTYDSARRRAIAFGGASGYYSPLMKFTDSQPTKAFNLCAALSLDGEPEWRILPPENDIAPPIREDHAVVIDSTGDRMLVAGGFAAHRGEYSDLWSMSLTPPHRWSNVGTLGTEAAGRRSLGEAIFDERANQMLYFGGGEDIGPLVVPTRLSETAAEMSSRAAPRSMPLWGSVLVIEGLIAGFSSPAFMKNGPDGLSIFNGLTGISAFLSPPNGTPYVAQITMGLGFIALASYESDASDRHSPHSQVFVANMVGWHVAAAAATGVEWLAHKLKPRPANAPSNAWD